MSEAAESLRGDPCFSSGSKRQGMQMTSCCSGRLLSQCPSFVLLSQWRRVLGDGDRLDDVLLLEQPSKVVTLSQNSTLLRGWHRRDGGLTWERSISTGASLFPAKLAVAEHRGSPAIAVLTSSALKVGSTLKHLGLAVGPLDGGITICLCLVCEYVQVERDWKQGPVGACQTPLC